MKAVAWALAAGMAGMGAQAAPFQWTYQGGAYTNDEGVTADSQGGPTREFLVLSIEESYVPANLETFDAYLANPGDTVPTFFINGSAVPLGVVDLQGSPFRFDARPSIYSAYDGEFASFTFGPGYEVTSARVEYTYETEGEQYIHDDVLGDTLIWMGDTWVGEVGEWERLFPDTDTTPVPLPPAMAGMGFGLLALTALRRKA